jgi:hypothetical protein
LVPDIRLMSQLSEADYLLSSVSFKIIPMHQPTDSSV